MAPFRPRVFHSPGRSGAAGPVPSWQPRRTVQIHDHGVVNSDLERRRSVAKVASAAAAAGLELRGLAASPLPGQDGNVEYFLWIKRRMVPDLPKIEVQDAAVDALLGTIWPTHLKNH